MRRAWVIFAATFAAAFSGGAIVCGGQALPQGVRPGAPPRNADEAAYRQLSRQRAIDAQNQGDMRRAEDAARGSYRLPQEKIGKLTPKEKKKIEAIRAPNSEDLVAYKEFLLQPETGIVRLLPGYDCESKHIVKVGGNCANSIPGGSFHRFRRDSISGDILFMDGDLIAEGFFSNSIMTGLGNIPLDQVTLNSSGLKYLMDFQPSADRMVARQQYLQFLKGVTLEDGHVYANRLGAVTDMTYALRIIAYKNGNNVTKRLNRYLLQGTEPPAESKDLMFLALKEDNRTDLTVSFRVIRKDVDGSVTLLWKILAQKESPEIVFPDDVALSDFK
jgi:hypothetical protein